MQFPIYNPPVSSLLETFLCVGSRAPFWKMHWGRLCRSAAKIGICVSSTLNKKVLSRIGGLEPHPHRARLVLGRDGVVDLSFHGYTPKWIAASAPVSERLICLSAPPDYPGRWRGLKTTMRAGLEKAYAVALRCRATDAILHRGGRWGVVYEATRGNIFWIMDDVVRTPDISLGILPGILRGWVIAQLRIWGIRVEEGKFPLSELKRADAVFRTNALIGVSAVREIASLKKWPGPPHPQIARLHRRLQLLFSARRQKNRRKIKLAA